MQGRKQEKRADAILLSPECSQPHDSHTLPCNSADFCQPLIGSRFWMKICLIVVLPIIKPKSQRLNYVKVIDSRILNLLFAFPLSIPLRKTPSVVIDYSKGLLSSLFFLGYIYLKLVPIISIQQKTFSSDYTSRFTCTFRDLWFCFGTHYFIPFAISFKFPPFLLAILSEVFAIPGSDKAGL